jgi:ribonuclease III
VFTHSSWAPDRASSYERLEFLGDSVLELAVARQLYERYPEFSEGRLAKIRSHVVSRASCAVVARELGLGERLVARGGVSVPRDELQRLSRNRNVLAALLEAALGALFLEHGFEKIEPEIVDAFSGRVEYALTSYVDHKTELQEALARTGSAVTYVVLDVDGPPHDRTFTCAAVVDGEERGVGKGPSKKAAEQEAARQVLERLAASSPGKEETPSPAAS